MYVHLNVHFQKCIPQLNLSSILLTHVSSQHSCFNKLDFKVRVAKWSLIERIYSQYNVLWVIKISC